MAPDASGGGLSPRLTAIGAMAHSRRARPSNSNQCSRRPTVSIAGIRGTVRRVNLQDLPSPLRMFTYAREQQTQPSMADPEAWAVQDIK